MRKVSVVITTYNHEKYIAQCFDSVLAQQGNFAMEIVVANDCSTDRTGEIIERYRQQHPELFRVLPAEKNIGITKNLQRSLSICTGDFIAICEGDDYWTDPNKLQKQIQHMEDHPDHSMCFNALELFYQQKNEFKLHPDQVDFPRDVVTIRDLIDKNLIGNFSCCMYRASIVRQLSPAMFDFYTVDWMFNMACGDLGDIGYLREPMSVYRLHASGAWSGISEEKQLTDLLVLIDTYNHFFAYRYHPEFSAFKKRIEDWLPIKFGPVVANKMIQEASSKNIFTPPDTSPVSSDANVPVSQLNGSALSRRFKTEWSSEPSLKGRMDILRRYAVIRFKNTFRPTWHLLVRARNRMIVRGSDMLRRIRS